MNDASMNESLAQQASVASGEPETDAECNVYKTVEFRMYCFKVLPCSKRFCHDWTNCPFAHPGEKARRRDPRVYKYAGIACPEMKLGQVCPRSFACPFAHNVFEYWLHPQRYRTQPCNDGPACGRKVCFFAHTLDELRVPLDRTEDSDESPNDKSSEKTDCSQPKALDGLDKILSETNFDHNRSINASQQFAEDAGSECAIDLQLKLKSIDSTNENQDTNELLENIEGTCSMPRFLLSNDEFSRSTSHSSTYRSSESENMALAALEQHHLPSLEQNFNALLSSDCDNGFSQLATIKAHGVESQTTSLDVSSSALQSGFHWNGGPPRLFVDRMINSRSKSFNEELAWSSQNLTPTFSFESENQTNDFFDSSLVAASQPFYLASLLSDF